MMAVYHHPCGVREVTRGPSKHHPCLYCDASNAARFKVWAAFNEQRKRRAAQESDHVR